MASGKVSKDVSKAWTSLSVEAKGASITAVIDGQRQPPVVALSRSQGFVSIISGYNFAYFDSVRIYR